jgi:hypothetical protein
MRAQLCSSRKQGAAYETRKYIPQGLKPFVSLALFGTTEVVP